MIYMTRYVIQSGEKIVMRGSLKRAGGGIVGVLVRIATLGVGQRVHTEKILGYAVTKQCNINHSNFFK
jgi:hypothetical protein